jgi:hypothetical protein
MKLDSLLKSVGVDLDDVKKHAENIIGNAKKELDLLHKKIDAQSQAMIILDQKIDALMAQLRGDNGGIGNSHDSSRTNGNDNRNATGSN